MQEIILALAKDLPSTAILILFLYLTNRQFERLLTMLAGHLRQLNSLLEKCIGGK